MDNQKKDLSMLSMVIGIVAVITSFFPIGSLVAIIGVFFGIAALRRGTTRKNPVLIGIVLSVIAFVITGVLYGNAGGLA
ncbi:hypothetical protein [Parasporobacterium paucivorans]|uniref:DUF4190 domain-containing protein n=1 Tax=Parasporobacterium paucivorans DSM 15970 TaxID=1122934 RepID=A0A1M6L2N2_9FIRM|nr:hypothetical protein [Parasporobacterium paucivorans]SHJ65426.1 hypothetical protein SAMN02745691_02316 [Parasporobacterium paucivorans DSM 15970]